MVTEDDFSHADPETQRLAAEIKARRDRMSLAEDDADMTVRMPRPKDVKTAALTDERPSRKPVSKMRVGLLAAALCIVTIVAYICVLVPQVLVVLGGAILFVLGFALMIALAIGPFVLIAWLILRSRSR